MKTTEKKGPYIVVSMRRFWNASKLDKHTADPTIHQTFAEAFLEASRRTTLSQQGQYAVFECIGSCYNSKSERKKMRLARKAALEEDATVRGFIASESLSEFGTPPCGSPK